jgi:urea carboxylase
LIANRGEIACRAIRTLQRMDLTPLAVYAHSDAQSLHVSQAAAALALEGQNARETYLNPEQILNAARQLRAEAIFPGYGFLSENAAFAEQCEAQGLTFIGPTPDQMRAFGLKHQARALAERANVPLAPGSGLLSDVRAAQETADALGYPVMLKSTAGGGGIGLSVCHDPAALASAFERGAHLGKSNFGDGGLFLEKFVARARHIEVQVFGDGRGKVIALGERDCSSQRRNQKVIEETPAPGLAPELRQRLAADAVRLLEQLAYRSAGTVEFIYDTDSGQYYFLEVNTRLQVEHTITERVTGLDLVEWMIETAQGRPPDLGQYIHAPLGHAIEVRIYAEDPARDFRPSSGLLTRVEFPTTLTTLSPPSMAPTGVAQALQPARASVPPPSGRADTATAKPESLRPGQQRSVPVRVDTWIEAGIEVSSLFDPLLAKLVVWGATRAQAVQRLRAALDQTFIDGIETNLDALYDWVSDPTFENAQITTQWLAGSRTFQRGFEVLEAGRFTTVQDYPGRSGHWSVGIPPSGAMDGLALRLGNRVIGNPEGAAAIEMTMTGAHFRFFEPAVICLAGADMQARIDGLPVERYVPITIKAGQKLELGEIAGAGLRAYLCVLGGIDVPEYLGSRATFTLGRFGGHAGRVLQAGDVLRAVQNTTPELARPLPEALIPQLVNDWRVRVIVGPHAAPDFFTEADVATFFATDWEVHYNSSRTGVRLSGPKPEWARADGGEAGLHPSNIHDCAYAFGAVDYTGDMPIILGPDGPSLGGFVCPAVVIHADLWKLGQLRPGSRVRFEPVTWATAAAVEQAQNREISEFARAFERAPERGLTDPSTIPADVRLRVLPAGALTPEVCYRPQGDKFLLVEYGPMQLDLNLRFRVRALAHWLEQNPVEGVLETTEGVRSLQVHFDSQRLRLEDLIETLARAEHELPDRENLRVPTRIVHLPLSWDDPATQLAIEKYDQVVRKDAPWAPSNIEFIRRINGLESIDEVRRIVFEASYLVLGLGDVYLGAPVATPIDPRHRLVTTKYNPARTWTPENAVGIGGAYLCVYGMEGPGGYQFVGRTLQMFNRFRTTNYFEQGKPWLLRIFDQIRFFPVSSAELLEMREAFAAGRLRLQIEERSFDLAEYNRFLADIADSAQQFREHQQAAFEAERQRWAESGQLHFIEESHEPVQQSEIPEGCSKVTAPVPGSVWKIPVAVGEQVSEGAPLVILESMKMEVVISAPRAGTVHSLLVSEGTSVGSGQVLLALAPEGDVARIESLAQPETVTVDLREPKSAPLLDTTLDPVPPGTQADAQTLPHELAVDVAVTATAEWAVNQLLSQDFSTDSNEAAIAARETPQTPSPSETEPVADTAEPSAPISGEPTPVTPNGSPSAAPASSQSKRDRKKKNKQRRS